MAVDISPLVNALTTVKQSVSAERVRTLLRHEGNGFTLTLSYDPTQNADEPYTVTICRGIPHLIGSYPTFPAALDEYDRQVAVP